MSLAPGRDLSHYRLVEQIGEGGMGVVWKATDTTLGRAVAIKVLPEAFARDPERMARFEREARLLASFNHPHIAAIYGVGSAEGVRFLAMELVEGEDLAVRLARGPIPVAEAVEFARQIAEALEAAHEKGIIHRDLKPANVKLTSEGQVKVLDFGLAKALEGDPAVASSTGMSHSPTITSPMTAANVILGTAAYMSPEQARGKAVDKRADIWAFGCVLYECLTGRRAFEGETVSDTIARILEREVDWAALPPATPPRVRELLERCLEKDARQRLRDIGEARLQLGRSADASATGLRAAGSAIPKGRRISWHRLKDPMVLTAILLAAVAGALLGRNVGTPRPEQTVSRFTVSFPANLDVWDVGLTPDGSALVMLASQRGVDSTAGHRFSRLYVRTFDNFGVRPLPGTENASVFALTQDSRQVLFTTATSYASVNVTLARVALDGGSPAVTLAPWDPEWGSFTALPGGDILTTRNSKDLLRIPAAGGAPQPLGRILCADSAATFGLLGAWSVIDDHTLLLGCSTSDSQGPHGGAAVLDLPSRRARVVLQDGTNPVLSPTGHLLFMRGDALLGLRCDAHGVPNGEAIGLLDGIRSGFALSNDGTLVYVPGGRAAARGRLVLVERDGRITPWSEDRRLYGRLYPPSLNGRRVAIGVRNDRDMEEIWLADLQRHELSRTLASTTAQFNFPCLSPDGSMIVYRLESPDARNGVYLQRTDLMGAPVRLLSSPPDGSIRYYPIGWSADGATVYLDKWLGSRAGLASLRVAAPRDTVVRDLFRREDSQAMNGRPSPDGRWIGFQWDQTGRENGYVAALLPDGSLGEPRRLTQGDGGSPEWSSDGHTVYWGGAQGFVAAPFDPLSGQVTGPPRVLLDSQSKLYAEVLPDGRLFAIQGSEEETNSVKELNVVLCWSHELERKMRGAGK